MNQPPTGDYIAVVVRLQPTVDGRWYIQVDGTETSTQIELPPLTLIVRLWRSRPAGHLRGTIQLHGTGHWAPIQSNAQLETLMRAWLSSGGAASSE